MDGYREHLRFEVQARRQFHHSSLLAGGPVAGAGEIEVVDGRLIR